MKEQNFLEWAIAYLSSPAGVPSIVILSGVLAVVTLRFLAGNKREVQYVKAALGQLKEMFRGKLGGKADAVFDAWLEGIAAIEDGDFTTQEMVAEFTKFVKIALGQKSVSLTPEEEEIVVEAATMTVQIMSINSKPAQKAVAQMMAIRN